MARDRQLNLRVTAEERRWYDEYRASGMSVEQAVGAILTARQMVEGPAVVVMPRAELPREAPVFDPRDPEVNPIGAAKSRAATKIEKDSITVERSVLDEQLMPKLTAKIKSGLCPHRVPRGTFCKRCATGG